MNGEAQPERRISVLMYHDLADSPINGALGHHPYVVLAAGFKVQMQLLVECGLLGTSLKDVLDRAGVAEGRQGQPCVITFDDGHESNFTRALPILQETGFRATFFVTAGWVGRAPYMTWEQLRKLSASGMEIGSHSMTHRPPASLRHSELIAEMVDSKKLLEDRLGQTILAASSPTGFFNPRIIPAAQEAGYRALCIGRIGLWTPHEDLFRIPRLPIKHATPIGDFHGMVRGERCIVARLRGQQLIRNGLKGALGIEGYLRLRRGLMRVLGLR